MIYSSLRLAKKAAHKQIQSCDCDVYVNEHHYPSGVEYSTDITPGLYCVYCAHLNFKHLFAPTRGGRRSAFDYAIKFEKQLNKCIFVREVFEERNGYKFRTGYVLTDVEPSDINE